jgi:crotonobetainyl-CoA:carnitine CoA-transferase CaiB-like acyl-CoA transferase
MNAPQPPKPRRPKPLKGIRIISLALNLPGPAALRRLADMGATCTKINPPAGDAMKAYTAAGYAMLHADVRELTLDLKDPKGQATLHKRLATTDVLVVARAAPTPSATEPGSDRRRAWLAGRSAGA